MKYYIKKPNGRYEEIYEPRPLEKLQYLQHQREITDRLFKDGKAYPMLTYELVGLVLSELEEIVRESPDLKR